MSKPLTIGDYVEWRPFFGKHMERGNIEQIDHVSGSMCPGSAGNNKI